MERSRALERPPRRTSKRAETRPTRPPPAPLPVHDTRPTLLSGCFFFLLLILHSIPPISPVCLFSSPSVCAVIAVRRCRCAVSLAKAAAPFSDTAAQPSSVRTRIVATHAFLTRVENSIHRERLSVATPINAFESSWLWRVSTISSQRGLRKRILNNETWWWCR